MSGKAKEGLDNGFRKQRAKGAPKPRFTYHKRRADWFSARSAWPRREPPVHALVAERAKVRGALGAPPQAQPWELVGPTNIGGRMTCVAVHPTNPDVLWAGAAGGGVWASSDAGRTWRALWNKQESLNVGALAVDPRDPRVVYCGTGEADLSVDSYAGVGLYRSTDAGETWNLIAPCATAGVPTRIGVIAIDPFDSNHLCLGGVGHQPQDGEQSSLGGLWVSRDGGATWRRDDSFTPLNYWCHSIAFDPAQRDTLLVVVSQRSSQDGIWQSRDGGRTWTHLTQGLPPPDKMDRTVLAIAPSNPRIVYAQVAAADERVLGIFRSDDGGGQWREVSGTHFRNEGQMNYGNTIVVHPEDPNHVLCGGVDLHLTTDGGKSWQHITKWDAERGSKHYAHADHHGLAMPPGAPGRVYDMNDGGMDVSEDGGLTWQNRSNGLAVTMFYDADCRTRRLEARLRRHRKRRVLPQRRRWQDVVGKPGERRPPRLSNHAYRIAPHGPARHLRNDRQLRPAPRIPHRRRRRHLDIHRRGHAPGRAVSRRRRARVGARHRLRRRRRRRLHVARRRPHLVRRDAEPPERELRRSRGARRGANAHRRDLRPELVADEDVRVPQSWDRNLEAVEYAQEFSAQLRSVKIGSPYAVP